MCFLRRDESHLSQYEASPAELQRRQAEHQEADRQDIIMESLLHIRCLEPLLDELGLYWCGPLEELKETLTEMQR